MKFKVFRSGGRDLQIRTRLLLALASVLIISFFATGFLTITNTKNQFQEQVAEQLRVEVSLLSENIKRYDGLSSKLAERAIEDSERRLNNEAHGLFETAMNLAEINRLQGGDREDLVQAVDQVILDTRIGFTGYAYALSPDGTLISHPRAQGKNLKGAAHIDRMITEKNGLFTYERLTAEDKPTVYAAYRYFPALDWVLVITVRQDELLSDAVYVQKEVVNGYLQEIAAEKIGDSGYFYIIDDNGHVVLHPDDKLIGADLSGYDFVQFALNNHTGSTMYDWEGERVLMSVESYPERNWHIVGRMVESEFLGSVIRATILNSLLVSTISIIIVMLVLWRVFQVNILRPVDELERYFRKLAAGDLSETLKPRRNDEIGTIVMNLDNMVLQMNEVLCRVNQSTNKVTTSSESMQNASVEVAKGAEQEAESVSQVEVAVHEMAATIQEISRNVEEVTNEVGMIRELADAGQKTLENTVTGINDLTGSVMGTVKGMNALGESSEQIGQILKVISDIADQTNLLALNAAIEAARAGDAGRGFAVVADEVRKLAERTAQATGEINGMVTNIQSQVNDSISEMDRGAELAQKGAGLVGDLREGMHTILTGVVDIADKITSVATSVDEQQATSTEISGSMADIAAIAQENAAIAMQNSQEAESLRDLADQLRDIVGQFKLKECMEELEDPLKNGYRVIGSDDSDDEAENAA